MVKNQRLAANVITPTTKAEDHDEPISPADIVGRGLMSNADWEAARDAALALFAFGQQEAAQRGLLLVDTKYEFGKDAEGNILLIDEVGGGEGAALSSGTKRAQAHGEALCTEEVPELFALAGMHAACAVLWGSCTCQRVLEEGNIPLIGQVRLLRVTHRAPKHSHRG